MCDYLFVCGWHADFGTNMNAMIKTKNFLASKFDMKDMGEARVILGVKIIRNGDSISLSQEHYIEKLLEKFGHLDDKLV